MKKILLIGLILISSLSANNKYECEEIVEKYYKFESKHKFNTEYQYADTVLTEGRVLADILKQLIKIREKKCYLTYNFPQDKINYYMEKYFNELVEWNNKFHYYIIEGHTIVGFNPDF